MRVNKKSEVKIRDKLVERGFELLNGSKKRIEFTNNPEANHFLNDLECYPHAFVLGCIMDRQIKAERAWIIPFLIMKKLGDFSMKTLLKLSENDIKKRMTEPKPLHRFIDEMSKYFFLAIKRIESQYKSDASLIWHDKPSSATVVYRFLEFDGIGPKIATMAANILARQFKVPFSDNYSIDISADVHVRRVFGRLGLTSKDATVDQVIYRARSLYPEFPGLMDNTAFEIGREWCRPHDPKCTQCDMRDLCVSSDSETYKSTKNKIKDHN